MLVFSNCAYENERKKAVILTYPNARRLRLATLLALGLSTLK